ncbi:hypothetical protein ACHAW6_005335 [Cyclotella cf. meneghiniana]
MLKINAYPDANFAGLYRYEAKMDPACAKSRTCFLITVSDCSIVWVSKLQMETTLSMMEVEIIDLAHCAVVNYSQWWILQRSWARLLVLQLRIWSLCTSPCTKTMLALLFLC